jgi:5-methylcytosine-specific restriction endonuclease McrA
MTRRNTAARDRDRARIRSTGAGCHICGEAIDYTLPYLHPREYVVDHVKPLTKGGADTIDNKAAAHRECNSKKRARDYAPIVRRSGSLTT